MTTCWHVHHISMREVRAFEVVYVVGADRLINI